MLIRALIVLLLVLNLGVAAWWMLRDVPAPVAAVDTPAGVTRLVLVKERGGAVAKAAPDAGAMAMAPAVTSIAPPSTPMTEVRPPAPTDAAPVAPADGAQCFSFGPFASDEDIALARSELKPRVRVLVERTQADGPVRRWRVLLPPAATLADAQATAERVNAAGFKDYFVVREGAEANAIALGRFGSESAARRHAGALVAAGFPARAEPIGASGGTRWLDVRAATGFDAAAAQAAAGAHGHQAIDCSAVR